MKAKMEKALEWRMTTTLNKEMITILKETQNPRPQYIYKRR